MPFMMQGNGSILMVVINFSPAEKTLSALIGYFFVNADLPHVQRQKNATTSDSKEEAILSYA